jgi:hypothetical protein
MNTLLRRSKEAIKDFLPIGGMIEREKGEVF